MIKWLIGCFITVGWFIATVLLCLWIVDSFFDGKYTFFNALVIFVVSMLSYALKEYTLNLIRGGSKNITLEVRIK